MSKSKVVRVIKLSIVAVIALAMPRATQRSTSQNKPAAVPRGAARDKVDVISPQDGQPDDEASPKAP